MAVNKIRRLIFLNQAAKTLKPLMAGVLRIMNMARRGVGNYDINPAVPPDLRPQHSNNGAHLRFGVLKRAAVVPVGAFQTQYIQAGNLYQPAVQIVASHGELVFKSDIMIALYIVKRDFIKMNQPRKIFRGKIAAGQDKIDAFETIAIDPAVQLRYDHIGDR